MLARYREKISHGELLAGIIASTVANHSLNPPKQPARPADYMPTEYANRRRSASSKPKRISRAKIANDIRGFLNTQMKVRNA